MSILGFIFIVILFFLLFAFAFIAVFFMRIWNFVRALMGKEPHQFGNSGFYHTQWGGGQPTGTNGGTSSQQKPSQTTISGSVKPRNSEFDKNEGEYVDFEEV